MIERILPAVVRSAYARTDPSERGLFPAEAAIVARAVERRKDEFATIRRCARTALAELGVPAGPILPGVRGAPVWPAGIVGSMTHCVGYRAAAVARSAAPGLVPSGRESSASSGRESSASSGQDSSVPPGPESSTSSRRDGSVPPGRDGSASFGRDGSVPSSWGGSVSSGRDGGGGVAGVGIDAEVDGPLPAGVARLVASEAEREHLAELADGHPGVHWGRVLFSAKESLYKVWSPMTGEWLDFLSATIEIDPAAATFTARVLVPGPIGELTGRYLIEDGLVLTAIVI